MILPTYDMQHHMYLKNLVMHWKHVIFGSSKVIFSLLSFVLHLQNWPLGVFFLARLSIAELL